MGHAAREDEDTKERLAQAEASIQKQLSRVDKERAEVERAVVDLSRASAALDAVVRTRDCVLIFAFIGLAFLFVLGAAS